jgi:hypothetical protein
MSLSVIKHYKPYKKYQGSNSCHYRSKIESNLICFVIDRYNNTNTIVIIDLINRIWNKFTLSDSNFMIISSNVQTHIPNN